MTALKKQYPESLKNFTARMLQGLKGSYANFRPDEKPEQFEAYAQGIERMVAEFGQGRTSAAIAKAVDYVPDFVPTMAKIREFVPSPGGKLTTCTHCYPDSYVLVFHGRTAGGNSIGPGVAVRRCDHLGGKQPVVESDPDGRTYGKADIAELWKIHKTQRLKAGKALTEDQLEWCLGELDRRISNLTMPSTGGKK